MFRFFYKYSYLLPVFDNAVSDYLRSGTISALGQLDLGALAQELLGIWNWFLLEDSAGTTANGTKWRKPILQCQEKHIPLLNEVADDAHIFASCCATFFHNNIAQNCSYLFVVLEYFGYVTQKETYYYLLKSSF